MIRHKDPDKARPCMVCGRPSAEHTPEERASGCKKEKRMPVMDSAARSERADGGGEGLNE